jgi:MOSC domain-containing protein YiiM
MSGFVVSLYTAPQAHVPMIALPVAHLVPGKGIEGDRYYIHPKHPQPGTKIPYEVTLVEQEALEALSAKDPGTVKDPGGRRNIVIRSCSLQTLAGCLFRIGEVVLRGATLREAPCDSSDHGQHSVCDGLHYHWLGASILTEGWIAPGDCIETVSFALEDLQNGQASVLPIQSPISLEKETF